MSFPHQSTGFGSSFWDQNVEYFGLRAARTTKLLFESLLLSPRLEDWVAHFIEIQPRYDDRPSDLLNQARRRSLLGPDITPDLAQTLLASSQDREAIRYIIELFAMPVHIIATLHPSIGTHVSNRTRRTEVHSFVQTLDELLKGSFETYSAHVSDPLSTTRLSLRRQLAQANICGTFKLLVQDFLSLYSRRGSSDGLSWDMFKRFVEGVEQVFATAPSSQYFTLIREALEHFQLDGFLDSQTGRDVAWEWDLHGLESESEEEEEGVNLDDLLDVCFEPIGPTLKPEHHAIVVTLDAHLPEEDCSICRDTLNVQETVRDEVPIKIECGHCFHYGCLSALINGIAKFSNLCPNCRHQICERRRRRSKDGKELESVQGDGAHDRSEDEFVGRSLQNLEGDVVMTDE